MSKRNCGFTLVEMLMVMLVMIIMMGMMMPVLLRMNDTASVDATVRELHGTLTKARMRSCESPSRRYEVIFNNTKNGVQSYENVDHWYALVYWSYEAGPPVVTGRDWTSLDDLEDADDNNGEIESKVQEVREGAVFTSFSYNGTNNVKWDTYTDQATWGWEGTSTAADATTAFGISFDQLGSASSHNVPGTNENGSLYEFTIGIGKDGAAKPAKRIVVEKMTGLASVVSSMDESDEEE